MKVKSESLVAQSCPTLCDPMDCSLPGSSVHEIFQARVLEWVAIAFSKEQIDEAINQMFHKSGVEIWSRGYVCNFRRRVLRIWVQMVCRVNSQSYKHYLWKPNCPWRDATNRWTSSRHCVPVTHLSEFTKRCSYCTCCGKHGGWRPEYLEGLEIIQYFPLKGQLSSGCLFRRL